MFQHTDTVLYLEVGYLGLAWSQSDTESDSCYAQQIPMSNIATRLEEIRTTLEVITERVFSKYVIQTQMQVLHRLNLVHDLPSFYYYRNVTY